MSKPIIQELRDARLAVDRAIAALEGAPDESRPVDWAKSNIDWQAIARRSVETEARRVKEMFRQPAPDEGYEKAYAAAREEHFAILRRNGIDTPVADCNDPYGIKDLGKLSFDELYLLMEREDRPGPRRDAIASAMQTAGKTPIEDTPPAPAIDWDARWSAKRAHERGAPPADDPRPRSETIIVRDKHVTPLREERGLFGWRRPADDPGAGVYFKRGPWWWPF